MKRRIKLLAGMVQCNEAPTQGPKPAEVAIAPPRSARGLGGLGPPAALAFEAAALWQLTHAGVHPAVAVGVAYGAATALRQAVAPKRMPGFTGKQQSLLSGATALLNSGCVAMVLSLAAWPVWLAWGLSRSAIWFGWNAPLQRFLAHIQAR